MRILTLSLFALQFLIAAAAYCDSDIEVQNSKYICRFKDGASKGSIGTIKRGLFTKFSKAKLLAARKSIGAKLKKASITAKARNKERLDARGTDRYFAIEQKYIEAYRKKSSLAKLRSEFNACIRGKRPSVDDTNDPLLPAEKSVWDPSVGYQAGKDGESAEDAFSYDSVNYEIFEKTLHGVRAIIAIHKETINSASTVPFSSKAFAAVVIDEIHEAIHAHGGFGVDKFLFKVRAPGDASSFALCKGGVSLDSGSYDTLLQAHEPFHSWNGKSYWPVWDNGGTLFQVHTFVVEELTVLFSYLIDSKVIAPYLLDNYLDYLWTIYKEYKDNPEYDLPYAELAEIASQNGTESSIYRTMMTVRGVLGFYAIYKELKSKGLRLDLLTKELYLSFGLTGANYSSSDVKSILSLKTGSNFDSIIDDFILAPGDLTQLYGESPKFGR